MRAFARTCSVPALCLSLLRSVDGAGTGPRSGVAPAVAYTLFSPGDGPVTANWADPKPIEVGLKFRASVPGSVVAIRFFKGRQNTGPHLAHLWSAAGALLASAAFSKESARGWQQVDLVHPVPISAGKTYIVSYHTAGHYSATSNYFRTAHANGPLVAPVSSDAGGNGVYLYSNSPGSFPTHSFQATNYWVDVVFSPYSPGSPQ